MESLGRTIFTKIDLVRIMDALEMVNPEYRLPFIAMRIAIGAYEPPPSITVNCVTTMDGVTYEYIERK